MKPDIKTFRAACRLNGIITDEDIYDFSDFIHDLKDKGYRGSGKHGDFTFDELGKLAREFRGEEDAQ